MDDQFDKDVRRMYEWTRNRIRKWVAKQGKKFDDCSFDALTNFNQEVAITFVMWHKKEMARLKAKEAKSTAPNKRKPTLKRSAVR